MRRWYMIVGGLIVAAVLVLLLRGGGADGPEVELGTVETRDNDARVGTQVTAQRR